MSSIAQYTTPTITLQFTDETLDLRQAAQVFVTFKPRTGEKLTKTGQDLTVDEKTISVFLTQAETARLASGEVEVQANWTFANGDRAASEIASVEVSRNLLDRQIE